MSDAAVAPSRRRLRLLRAALGRPPRAPRATRQAVLAGAAAVLVAVAAAAADVAGPDETPAQAYGPMQPGTTYAGTFRSADDVDHLAFHVDRAGEALHFVVNNTVQSCASEYPIECAVWGTLVDSAGKQLGGEGSSAGTGEVDPATTDVIDWTFAEPGTYYLAMDSGGMNPSYSVRYDVVAPPASSVPTPTAPAPVLQALSVRSPQRGKVVRARATFGQDVRTATAKLVAYRRSSRGTVPVSFGKLVLTDFTSGPRTLRVPVNRTGRRALARAGRLRLRLRLRVVSQGGTIASKSRLLTLTR